MKSMAEVLAKVKPKKEAPRPASAPSSGLVALSAILADKVGFENISPNSKWGQAIRGTGVARSSEFRRIEDLPRRVWERDTSLEEATRELTSWIRLPGGEEPCSPDCLCPRSLWPNQAAALIEATTIQGLFAPISVGNGKALISILIALVIHCERPLLLVPAQLRDQTLRKVLPQTKKHWRTHPRLRVAGYSELSLAKNRRMLFELRPDLIILDESHSVKNPGAARTKRLKEYLKEYPETRVVALSGTMTKRSLRDYWQLLVWTHKPDLCPMPTKWKEMTSWADALDEGLEDHERLPPGALIRFCSEGEEVRDGYRRRLTETPGVIASPPRELGCSLVIRERKVSVPPSVSAAMRKMRTTWETPYGDLIAEPVELWRHMRELALGFFYRWDPMPPRDWLDARKAWKKLVRETLKHNRRGLDSEFLVAQDCSRLGKAGKAPKEWLEWEDLKDTFELHTVPEWLSDFALLDASEWLAGKGDEEERPGIAWVEHIAFGEALSKASGRPYFGAGMKASAEILDATGSIIASMTAHGEGKNLQAWSRNLFTAPPSSGKTWEQVMGRTHREGQRADEVTVEPYLHAEELRASFAQARADARYITQTMGARQKLVYATIAVEGM